MNHRSDSPRDAGGLRANGSPSTATESGHPVQRATAPTLDVACLTPDDPLWAEFVAGVPHDFYHLPAYARMCAPYDGGQPEAILVRQGSDYFFLPYLVRPLAHIPWLGPEAAVLCDVVSPYGYPGPLASPGDGAFHLAAVAAWREAMCARGVVSAFIRLHPLFDTPCAALSTCGEVTLRGRTVAIDLTRSQEELWAQTSATTRNEISQSRRQGLVVAVDEDLAELPTFVEMYHETMARAGASRYYYFPLEYFQALREALGPALSLCLVRDAQGRVLCGSLFTETCGIVQYHLSAMYGEALPLRPTKLLLDFARTWAKARGNRVLHLGGGMGAREDSLFQFKARFSPERCQFSSWQVRLLPEVYDDLAQRRRGLDPSTVQDSYFPFYRS